ncbi:adenylate/guanylate cyclase domain-containing protein [Sinomonas atrocyanea]|uniref:adenylate/guanylate cyclase domain-containing protein n=1 Tax=Sinomonas atrocyanea TaxID=37927 RepID=UPI001141D768|nr:adenylate/guanylate cyclase domain-containing protein [Sinomonas atrocyanea]GEB64665.1 adenylate/guanylate cyclase domain-containing protein [Sinomonas atrocyanea]
MDEPNGEALWEGPEERPAERLDAAAPEAVRTDAGDADSAGEDAAGEDAAREVRAGEDAAEDASADPARAQSHRAGQRAPRPARRITSKDIEVLLLGGERTLKRREVAAAAGGSLYSARKLWRALGMPNFTDDDLAFTQAELEPLKVMPRLVREGKLTEEAAISVARAIGQMTDRMVVWQVEALVEDMISSQGMTDSEARVALLERLPDLVGPLEEMLVYSWHRQLAAGVQRLVVRAQAGLDSSEEGRDGTEDDAPLPLARAVGFADLVSYTSLSRRMNERTLAQLVQRFENRCSEIIAVGGGRLVKTIGDEVLYIAETPAAGAQIALALSKEFAEDEILPQCRVAMVWGRVLSRLGDIYGPTVNLAARLTAIAEPGQVLVDDVTAKALAGDERFVLEHREPEMVRGFGEIHPVALRHGTGPGIVLD